MQVQMQSLPAPQEVALETTGARLLRLLPMWTPPSLELHNRGCLAQQRDVSATCGVVGVSSKFLTLLVSRQHI